MPLPTRVTATSLLQALGFKLLSYQDLADLPTLGTAAAANVPATAGAAASSSEVVRGDDPRLATASVSDAKQSNQAVSVTNNTVSALATLALTQGTWRVTASLVFLGAGATVQKLEASITPGNGILKDQADTYACSLAPTTALTGEVGTLAIGPAVVVVPSGGLNLKLSARPFFSAGSVTAYHSFRADRIGS